MLKWHILHFYKPQNLISRKIWMIGKSWNFHTVLSQTIDLVFSSVIDSTLCFFVKMNLQGVRYENYKSKRQYFTNSAFFNPKPKCVREPVDYFNIRTFIFIFSCLFSIFQINYAFSSTFWLYQQHGVKNVLFLSYSLFPLKFFKRIILNLCYSTLIAKKIRFTQCGILRCLLSLKSYVKSMALRFGHLNCFGFRIFE